MELQIADMKVTTSTTAMMRSMMAQGADTSENTQMPTATILMTRRVTKIIKAIDADQRMPEVETKAEKADKEVVEEELDPGAMVLVVEKVEDDVIMPKVLMVLAAVAEVEVVVAMVKAESTVTMLKVATALLMVTMSTTPEKLVRIWMVTVMVPKDGTMAMVEEEEVTVRQKEVEDPVGRLVPSLVVVDDAAKAGVGMMD